MLNDAAISQFKKVYLAPGYTDLRRGIDGLASIVRFQFELDISIALSELDNIDQQIIIYKFELNHKPALSDEDIAKRLLLSQEDVVSRLACCLKILENSLVLKKYIRRCNLPALQ